MSGRWAYSGVTWRARLCCRYDTKTLRVLCSRLKLSYIICFSHLHMRKFVLPDRVRTQGNGPLALHATSVFRLVCTLLLLRLLIAFENSVRYGDRAQPVTVSSSG